MKFSIIYADPPWPYNNRISHKKTRFGNGAEGHYRRMTTDDRRQTDDETSVVGHSSSVVI